MKHNDIHTDAIEKCRIAFYSHHAKPGDGEYTYANWQSLVTKVREQAQHANNVSDVLLQIRKMLNSLADAGPDTVASIANQIRDLVCRIFLKPSKNGKLSSAPAAAIKT